MRRFLWIVGVGGEMPPPQLCCSGVGAGCDVNGSQVWIECQEAQDQVVAQGGRGHRRRRADSDPVIMGPS